MNSSSKDSPDRGPVPRALQDGHGSPADALGEVLPMVYRELREVAARALNAGGPVSIQPTDLLHEAYVRLSRERHGWENRANLMVAASVAMRRFLVDHIRRRRAAKRGGNWAREDGLDELAIEDRRFDTLDVEDALQRLEQEDAPAAEVAGLRLFGGYDNAECARALDVSTRTIERRWRFARAWLVNELGTEGEDAG